MGKQIHARSLLGLSITVLILSVIGLALYFVFFPLDIINIVASFLQIAIAALGIAAAVTRNRILLVIGSIRKNILIPAIHAHQSNYNSFFIVSGAVVVLDVVSLILTLIVAIAVGFLAYILAVIIFAVFIALFVALFAVFVHNARLEFRRK